ncbi:MAG: hypothetical protein WC617_15375 [Rhodanobacter sp.]|jgi:hypothetical protein
MADRLGFDRFLRLACQTVPTANVTFRRLVLDGMTSSWSLSVDAAMSAPR